VLQINDRLRFFLSFKFGMPRECCSYVLRIIWSGAWCS